MQSSAQAKRAGWSKRMSGASERANGRVSDPKLQSVFLVDQAHSASTRKVSSPGRPFGRAVCEEIDRKDVSFFLSVNGNRNQIHSSSRLTPLFFFFLSFLSFFPFFLYQMRAITPECSVSLSRFLSFLVPSRIWRGE